MDQATRDRLNALLARIVVRTKAGELPPDKVEAALRLIADGDFRDVDHRRFAAECRFRADAQRSLL